MALGDPFDHTNHRPPVGPNGIGLEDDNEDEGDWEWLSTLAPEQVDDILGLQARYDDVLAIPDAAERLEAAKALVAEMNGED